MTTRYNSSPCWQCSDRFYDDEHKTTCHSKCRKYLEYHNTRELLLESKRREFIDKDYRREKATRLKKQKGIKPVQKY